MHPKMHPKTRIAHNATDLGFGSDFDHLMSNARGSRSRCVDESVYLAVLFSNSR
jgi:hypothetical protein